MESGWDEQDHAAPEKGILMRDGAWPARGRFLARMVAVAAAFLISSAFGLDTGFPSGTNFPTKKEALSTLTDPKARTLMAAVFDGDERVVRQMLDADPRLASTTALRPDFANTYIGLLNAAIARQDRRMVDLLLAEHVSPDFPESSPPIRLAMLARDPWYLIRLLQSGANPNGTGTNLLSGAAGSGDLRSVKILLDHGADVNWTSRTGDTPLLATIAVPGGFQVAEYLLDHGANIWAVTPAGITIGSACRLGPTNEAIEEAARQRVVARIKAAGAPCPPGDRHDIVRQVLAGQWPPAEARNAGAKPPSEALMDQFRERWNPDGTEKITPLRKRGS